MKKLVTLGLVFSAVAAFGEVDVKQATEAREYVARSGGVFRYRWHEPKLQGQANAETNFPLVILMHGAGERGTDNVAQLTWGAKDIFNWFQRKDREFYFVAGQVPGTNLWVNTPWERTEHDMPEEPSETMAMQIEFLEKIMKELPIDPARVYVTGISMGGYGTWDLLCRRPEWFAAAMPVCGGCDVKQAAKIKDIPIWTYHGDRDDVVPFVRSRKITAALWAVDGKIKYTEYPGIDHGSWIRAYGTPSNLDWFFSQRKR